MKKCKTHILMALALMSATVPAFGDSLGGVDGNDSTITYRQTFEIGSDKVNPSKELLRFTHKVDSLALRGAVGNVSISGVASVDGGRLQNELLASRRAMALKDWLVVSTDLPANKILLFDNGPDWDMLRNYVAEDSNMPSRNEVLAVIDSDSSEAQKTRCLRQLSGGCVWSYLETHIFPQMRIAIVSLDILSHGDSTSECHEFPALCGEIAEAEVQTSAVIPMEESAPISKEGVGYAGNDCGGQRMALKSNLLYDAALMPSLELEYKFNSRWSVALEGNVAWWKNDSRHKYYQIATIVPEVKYHLNPGRNWAGHYLGLFAGGGKYDLENGKKGYYGEGGMLGISYNYVFNAGKRISFEAGLGVGAMYTRYKEYIPVNGYYLYQRTKHLWYGGPLRVKFAIVWRFWDNKCKGGDR